MFPIILTEQRKLFSWVLFVIKATGTKVVSAHFTIHSPWPRTVAELSVEIPESHAEPQTCGMSMNTDSLFAGSLGYCWTSGAQIYYSRYIFSTK